MTSISRPVLRCAAVACAGAVTALAIATTASARGPQTESPPPLTGGNGTFYIGGWPDRIYILDEASEKVVGDIKLQAGAARSIDLSHNRKRFYVVSTTLEDIEIVDIASRKSIERFSLSPNRQRRVRIMSLAADPLDRYLMLVTIEAKKLLDRYEIGPSQLVLYDLKQRKVTRTIPWPNGEERLRARMVFSPDGGLLYLFAEDVLIYETQGFKQVDRWELSRPLEEGLGRFEFGAQDETYEQPGFYTSVFSMRDPAQNRQIMGVARVNLTAKSVEFFPLGPSERIRSFAIAPDHKRAFGLGGDIGRYEFWGFDLEKRRLMNRVSFAGRPRMSISVSTNGKLLYIWQAGSTIDLYDAESYKHLRTIQLDFDNTTQLVIVPASPPERSISPSSVPGATLR